MSSNSSTVAAGFRYSLGLRTDTGQQRTLNEDSAETFDLPGMDAAFVVCDGMGGLRAGDLASREAVRVVREALTETFSAAKGGTSPELLAALAEALRRANDAVNALHSGGGEGDDPTIPLAGSGEGSPLRRQAAETGAGALMGTTCVAGLVRNQTLYLAHAGDSRAYLWRGGQLTRLTEDHSFVAERVRAGDMTEAEAKVSKFRNMITRAIGIDADVEPELRREPLAPGDLVLVCSDGLTTMVEDKEIAGLLGSQQTMRAAPERIAEILVDAANKRGGADNITVLIVRVQGDPGGNMASASPRGSVTSGVVDIDAPERNRHISPIAWLLLGAAVLAALTALVLYLLPGARQGALSLLGGSSAVGAGPALAGGKTGGRTVITPLTADFTRIVYSQPEPFTKFLARGDLLSYSPGEGLYFVAAASGKVACLTRTGEVLRSVESLEMAESERTPATPTSIFMTSDLQGNVYFSYTKRRVVEKKGTDGRLLARLSGFEKPEAIAVDEDGNLYVVDFNQIKILRARVASRGGASRSGGSKPPAAKPTAAPAATPRA